MISDDLGNPTLPQTIIMIPTKTTPLVYIPVATRDVVGGVKIGDGLNIDADGTLSFDSEQITIKTISVNGVEVQPDENDNIDLKVVEPYPLDLVLGEGFNHFEHDGRPLTFDELVRVTQDPSKDVWLRIAPYEDDENCVVRLNRYGQSSGNIIFIGNVVSETILSRYYVSTGSHYQYGYAVFNNFIELETTSNKTITIDRYSNTKYPTTKAVYDFVMENIGTGKVEDVLVNGSSVLGDDKIARVIVPTATSQLSNDSGFITDEDLSDITEDIEQLQQDVENINTDINNINELIPEQASAENELADKAFVNSSIQTNSANFRGNWNTWSEVPEHAADYPADYTGSRIPTVNDYLVAQHADDYHSDSIFTTVGATSGYYINESGQIIANGSFSYTDKLNITDDKDSAIKFTGIAQATYNFRIHAYASDDTWLGQILVGATGESGVFTATANIPSDTSYLRVSYPTAATNMALTTHEVLGTWRFKYTGAWGTSGKNGWIPEYQVNETPLTSDQLAAINSGITSGAVGQITTNQNNIETLSDGLQETDNKVTTLENDVDELKVLKLDANPTTETVGKVGQFALNVTSSALFQCVSVDEEGGVYTYTWQAVGGGADEELRNNTVQIQSGINGFVAGGATLLSNAAVGIGRNAKAGQFSVALGQNAQNTGGNDSVAIGFEAKTNGNDSIALGEHSLAQGNYTIQLGQGTNNKGYTFQIYNDNIYNHSTHTATFENLQLNGTDINTVIDNKINTAVISAINASY